MNNGEDNLRKWIVGMIDSIPADAWPVNIDRVDTAALESFIRANLLAWLDKTEDLHTLKERIKRSQL